MHASRVAVGRGKANVLCVAWENVVACPKRPVTEANLPCRACLLCAEHLVSTVR